MTTRAQARQADITTDISASEEFKARSYSPTERVVIAALEVDKVNLAKRAQADRDAAYEAALRAAGKEIKPVDVLGAEYDRAATQAAMRAARVLRLEQEANADPVKAELAGITRLLIQAKVYPDHDLKKAGNEKHDEETGPTSHRRAGKRDPDGPQYGKSRLTSDERTDNEKTRRRFDRVDTALAFIAG